MSYIAFVSTFPNEANMRDGYFRRVHHVDEAFSGMERVHLDIRFTKNWKKREVVTDPLIRVLHLNAFVHFRQIGWVLSQSGIVYIHSIAKVPSIWMQWRHLKHRVPFAIDLHGVMVDELRLSGHPLKAWFYAAVERFCFRNSDLNIYVSAVMKEYFKSKYPLFSGDMTLFSTPSNRQPDTDMVIPGPLQDLAPSDVVVVYSGNCQAWQNIGLMLDTMQKLTSPHIRIVILSGQKKHFEKLIRSRNFPTGKVTVVSVKPEELQSYYEIAHYGFILREDILVNRVANPTKLAEYLQYGIIPIVKLVEIGDYARYQYDYLSVEDVDNQLVPSKSQKNRDIYQAISNQYGSVSLRSAVDRVQKRYITPSSACAE